MSCNNCGNNCSSSGHNYNYPFSYFDETQNTSSQDVLVGEKEGSSYPNFNVSNCEFNGVRFDGDAIHVLEKLAEATIANANAISSNAKAISDAFIMMRASNINIRSMLSVGESGGVSVAGSDLDLGY